MAAYIFLPIPTAEMTKMANDIADTMEKNGKGKPGILRNYFSRGVRKAMHRAVTGGCLRMVHSSDTLFFIAHGTGEAGSQQVGANRKISKESPNDLKTYIPEEVATLLGKEGLPKTHVDFHLLCCGAGLTGTNAKHGDLARSFSGRVFDAMRASGFSQIQVTGYLGDVRAGAGDGISIEIVEGNYGGRRLVDDSWRITHQ